VVEKGKPQMILAIRGLLEMLILLMNLVNKKPMFVFQLQRKSIGRRRSNLI
jgi:hypothetical protein